MVSESPSVFTFEHPQLGRMTGLLSPDNIVQFRAVPYATLPARFKQSVPLSALPDNKRDFTNAGFACPHTINGDEVHSGGRNPIEEPIRTSESECFILQINVPLEHLKSTQQSSSLLPVLVYIHGGGFVLGKIDANHNTAYMAEQSISDGQPVITASIQYRLGALGFLPTPEGESNFGLHDQRNALLWIQKFVSGFGGNPNAVTVFGESAGALSICAHMLSAPPSTGPLFNRVVIMSGIIGPQTTPLTEFETKAIFSEYLNLADIEENDGAIEKLREMDVQSIIDASDKFVGGGKMWLPVQENTWFGESAGIITWDRVPELLGKCEWVNEIVIGCTSFEGQPLGDKLARLLTPKTFYEGISQQLGQKSAETIMEGYNLTTDMDPSLFFNAAVRWAGDVVFDAPTHSLCRYLTTHTNKKVYRYIFDVRNPFPKDNPLYQLPHHWVDVYFIFRTLQFRYPTKRLKQISDRHSQLWVEFANGKAPWSEYKYSGDGKELVMIANERDGWVVRSEKEDEDIEERSCRRLESLLDAWAVKKAELFSPLKIISLDDTKLV